MPASPALSEKPENTSPLQPSRHLAAMRLAVLLSLMLCGGLAGCGPASDNPSNLGPRTSMAGPSLSKHSAPPHNEASTPMASPLPLASLNGTGSVSGAETVPGGMVFARYLFDLLSQDIQWMA